MRRYVFELVTLAVRSEVLAVVVVASSVTAFDADLAVTSTFSAATAIVWIGWWLAADGRRHAHDLASRALEPSPGPAEPAARTAARVAAAAPIGLGVALAPVAAASWADVATPVMAGAVSGSLAALGAQRMIEAVILARAQRRTGAVVLHEPGPKSRARDRFFAQSLDAANR